MLVPGLEVIKLEFILRLKIKRNDWLLVRKQPIIALYFESETVIKFYNLETLTGIHKMLVRIANWEDPDQTSSVAV